jgi:hypothetical protein
LDHRGQRLRRSRAVALVPDQTGEVTAFGNRGIAPAEFPAGQTADIRDGDTLRVDRTGPSS